MSCCKQTRSIVGRVLPLLKWSTFNGDWYLLNLNLLAILDLKYNITVQAVAPIRKTLNIEIIARELKFL